MKKVISCLLALVLCVFCIGGCNKPTDNQPANKTPTNLVPKFEEIAAPLSRLTGNPVTVEIGQTGVSVELHYLAWPTITKGENGTLYAGGSLRRDHIDPFGATAFFESNDGGVTWSEPRIIYDSPIDDRDVGLLYIGEGKMVATFFTLGDHYYRSGGLYEAAWGRCSEEQKEAKLDQWNSYEQAELDAFRGYFIMTSDDYGQTWSNPIRVPFSCPHGPALMNDGKTLICSGVIENKSFATYTSSDFGKTWTMQSVVALPQLPEGYGYFEPYVIQLSDGSFLGGIRSENAAATGDSYGVWITKSQDGMVWTPAKQIPSVVGAPPHFLELSNGVIVMTYSYRINTFGVRACLSYDGGESWTEEQIVISNNTSPSNRDLGYPSSVALDDGTILTIYYQAYAEDPYSSILYTKWQLHSQK